MHFTFRPEFETHYATAKIMPSPVQHCLINAGDLHPTLMIRYIASIILQSCCVLRNKCVSVKIFQCYHVLYVLIGSPGKHGGAWIKSKNREVAEI